MGPVRVMRVTAIASLTPLEELDADPFLVDSRSQHAMCARWAAERGYVVSRELLVRGRTADGGLAPAALGIAAPKATADVVKELYDWGTVIYLPVDGEEAA